MPHSRHNGIVLMLFMQLFLLRELVILGGMIAQDAVSLQKEAEAAS